MKNLLQAYNVKTFDELKIKLNSDKLPETQKERQVRLRNEHLEEQIKFMKMRNKYFETFEVDISSAGKNAINEAIQRQKKELQETPRSPDEWQQIFKILVVAKEDYLQCLVCNDRFQKPETIAKHLNDNHVSEIGVALR